MSPQKAHDAFGYENLPNLFEAFLKCPTKCWLRANDEPASDNTYAKWVEAQDRSYGLEQQNYCFQKHQRTDSQLHRQQRISKPASGVWPWDPLCRRMWIPTLLNLSSTPLNVARPACRNSLHSSFQFASCSRTSLVPMTNCCWRSMHSCSRE